MPKSAPCYVFGADTGMLRNRYDRGVCGTDLRHKAEMTPP